MSVLTFADAAEKLATTERNIRRLVARRRLNGTQLGATKHLRLTDAGLEDYVARGAPDYDEPPLSDHGGLYDASEDSFLKEKIEGWIWEAAAGQFLSGEAVHSQRMKSGPVFDDVRLTASPTLRQVLDVPLPAPDRIQQKKAEALARRFRNRREFFFAMELRSAYGELARRDLNKWKPETFFESPESYQQQSAELMEAIKRRNLVKKVTYTPTVAQAAELREKERPSHPVEVRYLIPFAVLIEGQDDRLIEVAF